MASAIVKRPPDVFAAPVFARVRAAVMVTIAAGGLVFTPASDNARLFFQLMSLGGLPLSLLLLATVRRLGPRTHAFASAAADLVGAVAVHTLLEDGGRIASLAYVVIAAIVAITAGFLPGLALTVFGVGVNAFIDLVDTESVAGDFNPAVHIARLGLATLLVYLVARATDDRRRAQASQRAASVKAETILSKVSSAVVVTDPTGRLLEWNDAAAAVMASTEDLTRANLTCDEALNLCADGRPLNCSTGCGLLRLRHEYPEHDLPEISRNLPDGRKQPLVADAVVITDSDGVPVEVVHSIVDITRLKQADEAKTLFLATASHELKTPLTVIGGFAELMLTMPELPESQKREALETIRRRTGELAAIVDRLLLSSRIDAGRVTVIREAVDVEPLVCERSESLARATGREIVMKTEGVVPRAEADPSAVTTIVDHLLENAIRYSPGGERVEAVVRANGEAVEVAIKDGGIGMDREQQELCFDRFWQAESTDVRRFGGTGIGLYIVKSLAEAMGGTVTVASSPGRGTTFTMRLPKSAALGLDGENGAMLGEVLGQLESPSPGGTP